MIDELNIPYGDPSMLWTATSCLGCGVKRSSNEFPSGKQQPEQDTWNILCPICIDDYWLNTDSTEFEDTHIEDYLGGLVESISICHNRVQFAIPITREWPEP